MYLSVASNVTVDFWPLGDRKKFTDVQPLPAYKLLMPNVLAKNCFLTVLCTLIQWPAWKKKTFLI